MFSANSIILFGPKYGKCAEMIYMIYIYQSANRIVNAFSCHTQRSSKPGCDHVCHN